MQRIPSKTKIDQCVEKVQGECWNGAGSHMLSWSCTELLCMLRLFSRTSRTTKQQIDCNNQSRLAYHACDSEAACHDLEAETPHSGRQCLTEQFVLLDSVGFRHGARLCEAPPASRSHCSCLVLKSESSRHFWSQFSAFLKAWLAGWVGLTRAQAWNLPVGRRASLAAAVGVFGLPVSALAGAASGFEGSS